MRYKVIEYNYAVNETYLYIITTNIYLIEIIQVLDIYNEKRS